MASVAIAVKANAATIRDGSRMTLRQDLLSMTGSSTVLVDVMMAADLTATYAKDTAHVLTTLDFQALLLVVGAARATLILARHLILVRPNNGFLQCFLRL